MASSVPKKVSKFWPRIKDIAARTGERAAVLGIASAGVLGTIKGYQKIMGPIEFRRDFNAMLTFDKSLKSQDRDQVEARFRTLRTFNKPMSQDPLVASSFVKQTLEIPHVPPTLVGDLVKAQPEGGTAIRDITRMVSSMVSHED